ncbi:MAG: hypothetical protein QM781_13150 [Chitinophagaceae bacterium]
MIKYTYDATGNRIGKWVQVGAGTPRQTAYVRDASGNVMAIMKSGAPPMMAYSRRLKYLYTAARGWVYGGRIVKWRRRAGSSLTLTP